MKFSPGAAGALVPAALLSLLLLSPLHAQEEDFDGDGIPVMEGAGITVTGTVETTQQIDILGREEIERAHAPDLGTLLQETLGLGLTRYGGYGNQTHINMRGFDAERIAVLIDGVPVNSAMSGDFDISGIDLASIERIEVVYGGSDSKFNVSGAMGGVINIVTVKDLERGLRIRGSVSNTSVLPGDYTTSDEESKSPAWQDLADAQNMALSAGIGLEGASIQVSFFANRAANHFLYTHYTGEARRKTGNEVIDTGGGFSVIRNLGDYSRLAFSGDFYYANKDVPWTGHTATRIGSQRDVNTRQTVMLDMPRLFGGAVSVEASLSHFWGALNYQPPSGAESHHDQRTFGAINRWTWYASDFLTLRAGGDYRFANLDSNDIGYHDRHDGGAYLTLEFAPAADFLVIPSVKAVLVSDGDSPLTPVPKLGLVWRAGEGFTLKANGFRSFKNPDLEDLYWNSGGMFGNPGLEPEDGWGGDLGFALDFRRDGGKIASFEATGFVQWLQNSIHWAPTGTTWRPENVGESMHFGADVRLRWDIPLGSGPVEKLEVGLSYKYLLSYLLSFGFGFGSDKRIPYQPLHSAGFSLSIPWERGSLLVTGHFEDSRFTDRKNLSRLKPYFLLNLNLEQELTPWCSLFAVLRNALNWSYESYYDYPMPGAALTLGARFSF